MRNLGHNRLCRLTWRQINTLPVVWPPTTIGLQVVRATRQACNAIGIVHAEYLAGRIPFSKYAIAVEVIVNNHKVAVEAIAGAVQR